MAVPLVVLVTLVLIGAIGALRGSSDAAPVHAATDALLELTERGDEVAFVGPDAARLVPSGRVAIRLETVDDLPGSPRHVVVSGNLGAGERELVTALDRTAKVMMRLDRASGPSSVYERRAGPLAAEPASSHADAKPTAAPLDERGPEAVAQPISADAAEPIGQSALGAPEAEARVVLAGEHFWGIATERLTTDLGRVPTNAEVTGYWTQVIDVNQDILVEPENPSVLLVGQTIQLPPTA